jgi:hypothetical protein
MQLMSADDSLSMVSATELAAKSLDLEDAVRPAADSRDPAASRPSGGAMRSLLVRELSQAAATEAARATVAEAAASLPLRPSGGAARGAPPAPMGFSATVAGAAAGGASQRAGPPDAVALSAWADGVLQGAAAQPPVRPAASDAVASSSAAAVAAPASTSAPAAAEEAPRRVWYNPLSWFAPEPEPPAEPASLAEAILRRAEDEGGAAAGVGAAGAAASAAWSDALTAGPAPGDYRPVERVADLLDVSGSGDGLRSMTFSVAARTGGRRSVG